MLDDENVGDVSGLTRKSLFPFSQCAFYSIINPFFCLRLHVFRPSQYSMALLIYSRHRLLRTHLDIPLKVPVALGRFMTIKGDVINDISAQLAIICPDPGLFPGFAG